MIRLARATTAFNRTQMCALLIFHNKAVHDGHVNEIATAAIRQVVEAFGEKCHVKQDGTIMISYVDGQNLGVVNA